MCRIKWFYSAHEKFDVWTGPKHFYPKPIHAKIWTVLHSAGATTTVQCSWCSTSDKQLLKQMQTFFVSFPVRLLFSLSLKSNRNRFFFYLLKNYSLQNEHWLKSNTMSDGSQRNFVSFRLFRHRAPRQSVCVTLCYFYSKCMRHSRRRRQNPTKSLKISVLRQKDDSTAQVRQFHFYLALFNTYI